MLIRVQVSLFCFRVRCFGGVPVLFWVCDAVLDSDSLSYGLIFGIFGFSGCDHL